MGLSALRIQHSKMTEESFSQDVARHLDILVSSSLKIRCQHIQVTCFVTHHSQLQYFQNYITEQVGVPVTL
jgi:hypothetical protein